ncbi:MAG: DNA polymerase III subunit gamma/tau [Bacilli bacterium]|jgi:DNA polymerase-3 subunit gamma/tau|nr:DNA polymerase III subunit gamma/tau [Bacilli bacterium]
MKIAYKALYRTYRPQLFREVVGQDVVVKTIQNAIANNKISHAYLLSGPRGTGKTTIARIFAKTLNCENRNPDLIEPCDRCVSCHEISDSISPDVIEIDAASNNGVDEIREIRDKVRFLPGGAKYKIYIIDEVHMLSAGAFNALLKTLEEPPKHVIFILATTEPQKLPATIISRCQRFDFKLLSVNEIAQKLRLVANNEGAEISEEAVNAISEAAEGGLRDALSILDQAISYSNEKVTIEEVNLVTGNLSYDRMIQLAEYFEKKEINGALEVVGQLIESGKEVGKLVNSLLQFYRDMLLFKNVDSVMYAKYIFEKEAFKTLAEQCSFDKIFFYIDVLSDVQAKVKYSPTPRIYLEIAIIKMMNISKEELNFLNRIVELERKVALLEDFAPEEERLDDEKVSMLDLKVNRIVNELNKLELPSLINRITDLEKRPAASGGTESMSSDIERKLSVIQEDLQVLKMTLSNFKNKLDNNQQGKVDSDLVNRIETLEKQKASPEWTNLINEVKYLQEDIDYIKQNMNKNEIPKEFDLSGLIDKVNKLEKKMYELLSEGFSQKPSVVKKTKKTDDQIVLFTEDLVPIQEFKKPIEEKVDFKEFSRPTVEVNKDDLSVKKNDEDSKEAEEQKEEETQPDSSETKAVFAEPEKEETPVEVIQETEKPKSQLVITKREGNLFDREKELLEKELSTIRPTVKEAVKIEEKQEKDDSSIDIAYRDYNVKSIEKILHEARMPEARNEAKRIKEIWENLEKRTKLEDIGIVETLKLGNIVAVGNNALIITFATAAFCNQVMRPSFKNKSLRILFHAFGNSYHYIALPDRIWLEKRQEYINQYNIGTKYPTLSPIDDPELVISEKEDTLADPKDRIVSDTIGLFGESIVKFE